MLRHDNKAHKANIARGQNGEWKKSHAVSRGVILTLFAA